MPPQLTYRQLFALLRELGFIEAASKGPDRVFQHADTGVILVYSSWHGLDDAVISADLVSTERHLCEKLLIVESLQTALHRSGMVPPPRDADQSS